MIRLYPDQLKAHLQKLLYSCYLLFGSDPFLLKECRDDILFQARKQKFNEHFTVMLDENTDWDAIFSLFRSHSLFSRRQTLLLILPENGIQVTAEKKLHQLVLKLHDDLLLILYIKKMTFVLKNASWFKALDQKTVIVNCTTPEQNQLLQWVMKRAKNMQLKLDDVSCQLLCYYYEGNLLAIAQVLEQLLLIYKNNHLTLPQVSVVVNDAARFTPFHWADSVIAGKIKRSMHILRQLQLEAVEPLILLRIIQHNVLQLLILKRKMFAAPIHTLFNQYEVWQNRRPLFMQALKQMTLSQLKDAVALMTRIELTLKQDYNNSAWSDLNTLTLLLCGKTLSVDTY